MKYKRKLSKDCGLVVIKVIIEYYIMIWFFFVIKFIIVFIINVYI